MFSHINDLPNDILGITIFGKTTKADYNLLNPIMKAHKEKNETIKMFVDLKDFEYTAGAFWEDFKFSINYLEAISAIALVTKKEWIEKAMEAFGALVPNLKMEGFQENEREKALAWLKNLELAEK
ncbi:SpoIIAA family protein [Cochleicola gelatinilyticus]|uniref:STAS/SEC14 domain-containing protein n=1 Tax=Cochleicola gelatinilyticus TaxID=1763537 RepID=A0A167K6W8_9FLAO|nr:STAS/SEC14 domain-containing protein [Cochleicola gelatinilyticus]OAB81450.1 hypothetical protein ULVI_01100 [Cochleicola gelatinilyticus]